MLRRDGGRTQSIAGPASRIRLARRWRKRTPEGVEPAALHDLINLRDVFSPNDAPGPDIAKHLFQEPDDLGPGVRPVDLGLNRDDDGLQMRLHARYLSTSFGLTPSLRQDLDTGLGL